MEKAGRGGKKGGEMVIGEERRSLGGEAVIGEERWSLGRRGGHWGGEVVIGDWGGEVVIGEWSLTSCTCTCLRTHAHGETWMHCTISCCKIHVHVQ